MGSAGEHGGEGASCLGNRSDGGVSERDDSGATSDGELELEGSSFDGSTEPADARGPSALGTMVAAAAALGMARLWARSWSSGGWATPRFCPVVTPNWLVNGGGAKSPMSREAEGTAKDTAAGSRMVAGREDLLVLAGESLMAKACWVETTAVLLVGESEDFTAALEVAPQQLMGTMGTIGVMGTMGVIGTVGPGGPGVFLSPNGLLMAPAGTSVPPAMTILTVQPSALSHAAGMCAQARPSGAGLSKITPRIPPKRDRVWLSSRKRTPLSIVPWRPRALPQSPTVVAFVKRGSSSGVRARTCDAGTTKPFCRHSVQNLFLKCNLPRWKLGSHCCCMHGSSCLIWCPQQLCPSCGERMSAAGGDTSPTATWRMGCCATSELPVAGKAAGSLDGRPHKGPGISPKVEAPADSASGS